jgi:hypothetical protein
MAQVLQPDTLLFLSLPAPFIVPLSQMTPPPSKPVSNHLSLSLPLLSINLFIDLLLVLESADKWDSEMGNKKSLRRKSSSLAYRIREHGKDLWTRFEMEIKHFFVSEE